MSGIAIDEPFEAAPRAALLEGVGGPIAGLPLLRTRDGRLEQAVRVTGAGAGEASIAHGGTILDRASLRDGRALLFVPAVDEQRTFAVELPAGGREVTVAPARRWEVSLIHHSHLDVGYTDPQPLVLAHHLDFLDAALDHVEQTASWPDDARLRWNVEANLPLTRWLATRPARDRAALLEHVAGGRIEVCALPFTMHTEAYSLDELARTLVPAQQLRERHGIEIVTAMQSDVPGAAVGLCELLASAGVRYLSVAHNYAGRSVPHLHGGQELARPFWWRAPSGKRVLVWHTDSPHGIAYMEGNLLGFDEDYETVLDLFPEYLLALATRPYPYPPGSGWLTGIERGAQLTRTPQRHELLHLRVQGAFADNAAPSLAPARIVREWNERWTYPRLRMATNREVFAALEERLGDTIPTYGGDWADWWADGIGSAARELGRGRRAQAGARAAQTLHALADALGERDGAWRGELDRAYEDMALFDEHTWGAADPWRDGLEQMAAGALQWQWKAARAHAADERVGELIDGARSRLAGHVPTPEGAYAGVLVFNPSAYARTDAVELLALETRVPITRALAVVDVASGERVPCALEPQAHAAHRPRGQRLRFLARDVPACGFARYAIVPDDAGVPEPGAGDPAQLDSAGFTARLDVARGCLASLVDMASGAELVNGASAFGFGQYVYDRYGTASRANHLSSQAGGAAAGRWLLASRETAGDGVLVARTASALEESATIRLRAPGAASLSTTFRLVHGAGRLDVLCVLDKAATTDKEAVFFAFPFALDAASVSSEITGGVHRDGDEVVPGSAVHMRAVRHWVALDDGARAVGWGTREAPLVQIGNLHLPYAPFPPTVKPAAAGAATVFSWAMNNGWDTNFPPSQGGETPFAYAVTAGRGPDARAAGAIAQPLVGVLSSPRQADSGLPARGRLCALDRPDVEVLAIGPSRIGGGLAALLHSTASEPVDVAVAFPDLPVARAAVGDFLERDPRPFGERVRIAPGELVAVTLELEAS
jgi:hypothetical protein